MVGIARASPPPLFPAGRMLCDITSRSRVMPPRAAWRAGAGCTPKRARRLRLGWPRGRCGLLGLLCAAVKPALFRLAWLLVWTCACGGKAAGTGSAESRMDASDELAAKVPSHDDAAALSDAHTTIADANGSPTIDATLADASVVSATDAYSETQVASGPLDAAAETGPMSTLCN